MGNSPTGRPQTGRPEKAAAQVNAQVGAAIEPILTENKLIAEEITFTTYAKRAVLQIVIDLAQGPGGIDSDLLAQVSREIAKVLDEVWVAEAAYMLEITTPGAERDLTDDRLFGRAIGRTVAIMLTDRSKIVGILQSVNETEVVLDASAGSVTIARDEITKARTRVVFERPNTKE